MKDLKFQITGVAPILFHNGQTANPFNEFAKRINSVGKKGKKTDADRAEIARIEFYAAVYTQDGRLVIPAEVWESAIVAGAKKSKNGKVAQAAIYVPENAFVEFDGDDLTMDQLWERGSNTYQALVRVAQSKVLRTRFRIDEWACALPVRYDEDLISEGEVKTALEACGAQVGVCDWRPKFGRFTVKQV